MYTQYMVTAYVWLTWTSCFPPHWADKTRGQLTFSRHMSVVCAQKHRWSLKHVPLFIISHYCLLVKIDSIYPLSLEKQRHALLNLRDGKRDKERACPHPVTNINNTSNPSLISYILLHCWVHLWLEIAFMDLLLFVSLCVCAFLLIFLHNVTQPFPTQAQIQILPHIIALHCADYNFKWACLA